MLYWQQCAPWDAHIKNPKNKSFNTYWFQKVFVKRVFEKSQYFHSVSALSGDLNTSTSSYILHKVVDWHLINRLYSNCTTA